LGHRSSQIKVHCNPSINFLVEPFIYAITYVDPDIAGKRVSEYNSQLFSWLRTGDKESKLPIVTSTIDTTMLANVNAAMAVLAHPSQKI
jgi:hypothetical protein